MKDYLIIDRSKWRTGGDHSNITTAGDDCAGWHDTKFTNEAIGINDDEHITSEEREKAIKEHFATIGVNVQFKGKYVKS